MCYPPFFPWLPTPLDKAMGKHSSKKDRKRRRHRSTSKSPKRQERECLIANHLGFNMGTLLQILQYSRRHGRWRVFLISTRFPSGLLAVLYPTRKSTIVLELEILHQTRAERLPETITEAPTPDNGQITGAGTSRL